MVKLEVGTSEVTLQLTNNELFWGCFFCCGSFDYPISSIKTIRIFDNFWKELRGLKVGAALPYAFIVCSRYHSGGKDLWAYYGKGPGIVIEFENQPYKKWVLSLDNNVEVADELRKKIGENGDLLKEVEPVAVLENNSPLQKLE